MTQVIAGRAIEYVGQHLLGTPPSRVNNGVAGTDQVAVGQLLKLRENLEGLLNDANATRQAGDDAIIAQLQQGIAQLNDRIDAAVEGLRDRVVVGAMVTALADVAPTLPGIDIGATNGYSNLILVNDPSNLGSNGVYLPDGTRDPRFPSPTDFQVGQFFFVDGGIYANSHWYVSDETTASSLRLLPFGRAQDLNVDPSSFTTIAGNTLTNHLNPEWFSVSSLNGVNSLDFSQAFINWKDSLSQDVQMLTTELAQAQQVNAAQDAAIAQIQTNGQAQEAGIASLNNQITAIQTKDTQQDTAIGNIQATINTIQAKDTQQDTVIGNIQSDITTIQQTEETQNATLGSLQRRDQAQDAVIATIQLKDSQQDSSIAMLVDDITAIQAKDVQQDTAIAAIQTKNTQQDATISSLQTTIATKATIAEAETAFVALLRRYNPIRSLIEGVVGSQSVTGTDPNTGVPVSYTYITTTFTIELGEPDFRMTELSEAIAPYQSVRKPEISYPGTQCIIRFYTRDPVDPANPQPGEGAVPNGEFEAWFHKGFR